MKDIIDIIKSDKRARVIAIFGLFIVFTFTLGLSLSAFSNMYSKQAANITVNGLSFNITTNEGGSNDRILKLKAGSVERFSTVITNKNSMNVKYELIYEYCGEDSECKNPSEIPSDIVVGLDPVKEDDISGEIESSKTINLLTSNQSSSDKYIRLSLNAGYSWNDLALVNQIGDYYKDITFIAYVDGIEQEEFPDSCNYSYTYKTYVKGVETSDSEVSLSCSNNKWNIYVSNIPSKVEVYFVPNLANYIASLDKTSNGLEEDDFGNLRYVGNSPNNYLTFNNETWRIIGIVEGYVKIIRNTSIGTNSWHSSYSNDWSKSSLMMYLRDTYYYTLNTTSQNQIQEITWKLGGITYNSGFKFTDLYNQERGSVVYSGNQIQWDGKIALMYASDYGYASTYSSCRNNLCSSICASYNWLQYSSSEWLLSAYAAAASAGNAAGTYSDGGISGEYGFSVTGVKDVRPTLHLKSNIVRKSGTGTSSNPYTIE